MALAASRALGGSVPELGPETWVLVLLTMLLKIFAGGGLGEEIGWRGFALPRLLSRMGWVRSSAGLGAIWAIWQLPALWLNGMGALEILGFFVAIVGLSFVFTWLHVVTGGSLFFVVVFHAAINSGPAVLDRLSPELSESRPFSLAYFAAVVLLALGVVMSWRWSVARRGRAGRPRPG